MSDHENSPKKPFNWQAEETLEVRKERLQGQAEAIDEALGSRGTPQMKLTPSGPLRQSGDNYARQQMLNQRTDLSKELDKIEKRLEEKRERIQKQSQSHTEKQDHRQKI